MPFIILEDRKGFKKSHGWLDRKELSIRMISPRWKPASFKDQFLDPDDLVTYDYIDFYPDQEIYPDVWIYKERI